MWICAGEDFTSNSEVGQPTSTWPLVQECTHPEVTIGVGWGGDGTNRAIAGIESWSADAAER